MPSIQEKSCKSKDLQDFGGERGIVNMNHLLTDYMRRFEWPEIGKNTTLRYFNTEQGVISKKIINLCKKIARVINMKKKKYTVIDLFAGCGGLSLGLYQAGWQGIFAIEKNPCAYATLSYNLIEKKKHFNWPKWLPQEPLDIAEVNKTYSKQLKNLRGTVDLVAGGPPCQGFSMAGRRIEDDVRNQLVFAYIDFISMVMPKILLFENVKGFTYAFDKKRSLTQYHTLQL